MDFMNLGTDFLNSIGTSGTTLLSVVVSIIYFVVSQAVTSMRTIPPFFHLMLSLLMTIAVPLFILALPFLVVVLTFLTGLLWLGAVVRTGKLVSPLEGWKTIGDSDDA